MKYEMIYLFDAETEIDLHTLLPLRMAASRSERASLIGTIPGRADFLAWAAASKAHWPTAAGGRVGLVEEEGSWRRGRRGGGGAPEGGWEGDGT